MSVQEAAPLLHHSSQTESAIEERTIRKLDTRVLLLCTGVAFLAYVDRSNIGYAAKDLCNDLDLTHEEYGIGVSMFYAGYLTSQVGSAVMLKRVGAPAWLGFIMFAWGVIAASMGFMQNTAQFYVLRGFLGVAEGGSFPSIWYLLSLFYPESYTTGACSVVFAAVSFALPISSPISAGLLSLGPVVGVEGWRLLFVVEGLMPIAYAVVICVFLPRDLESASFLEPEEKEWIAAETGKEDSSSEHSLWEEIKIVLKNRRFYLLGMTALITFGVTSVLMFWATLIIHDMLNGEDDEDSKTCGSKDGNAVLAIILTAIPYLLSGIGCLWVKFSTITNRTRFSAFATAFGAVSLISWVGTREVSFVFGFVSLTLTIGSATLIFGPVIGLTLTYFDNSTKATASSMFNTMASIGAATFPPIIGKVLDDFGYGVAIPLCGGFLMVAAIFVFPVKDTRAEADRKQDALEESEI